METIFILFVLIVALIGLIGLRKENESSEEAYGYMVELSKLDLDRVKQELNEEKKSNASNQGWNTKYRKTIEELEERIEAMILDREGSVEKNQDQADTIKRMSSQFDEVHVLLETLLVTPKKKQAELVNKFIFETK